MTDIRILIHDNDRDQVESKPWTALVEGTVCGAETGGAGLGETPSQALADLLGEVEGAEVEAGIDAPTDPEPEVRMSNGQIDTPLKRIVGADAVAATDPGLRYRNESDVIGSVERSGAGNTVLRVGTKHVDQAYWMSGKAHVVLTPAERDELIEALLAHQREDMGK